MTPARLLVGIKAATRRMVSDWPVVAAALATIVLSAALVSAGPIYGAAISISAFDRAMENAEPLESGMSISARPFTADFDATNALLNEQVTTAASPAEAKVTAIARASILELTTGDEPNPVETWYVQGIEDLATLTDGRWPADDGTPPEVAVPVLVAEALGIEVGDTVSLSPRSGGAEPRAVPVVGTFTIDDVDDITWFTDPLIAAGSIMAGGEQVFGPLIATRDAVVDDLYTTRLRVTWRVAPDFGTLRTENLADFSSGITRLAEDLNERVLDRDGIEEPEAITFTVQTGLQDRISSITRSLSVTNSTVLAVVLQLSLLALYALILTSRLVVDARTSETALARSRGTSPTQLAVTAAFEGLLLAIPAILIGPPLAAQLIKGLNRFGPLASIGLSIDPEPNSMAYTFAAAAAVLALVSLLWPAFRAARAFPDQHPKAQRQSGRSSSQKLGIDIALVALVAIAIWQLGELGPGVSTTVRGRFGVDPLLVVAPALGLAAGVVLALRVVPRLARAAERMVAARVAVVPALALWQVARRPDRYARSALLLMTTVALGVFASSFSASWVGSQFDQASHRVGADIRFTASSTPETLADIHMRSALESLPDVERSLPVNQIRGPIGGSRQARFVITDAAAIASVVQIRSDVAGDLEGLAKRLVDQRISLPSIQLPGEPARLAMTWEAHEVPRPDEPDDAVEPCPDDGRPADCFSGMVHVVITDGNGSLHRLPAGPIYAGHGPTALEVDFVGPNGEKPEYPLSLALIEVDTHTGNPFGEVVSEPRTALVSMLSAEVVDTAGESKAFAAGDSDYSVTLRPSRSTDLFTRPQVNLEGSDTAAFTFKLFPGLGARRNLPGRGELTVAIAPAAPPISTVFPVVATNALLDEGVWQVGMRLSLRPLGLGSASGEIIGTVPAISGVDSNPPLVILVDLPTYQALKFEPGEPIERPEEFWLATDDTDAVAAAVAQPPILAGGVVERESVVSELTSDPIALGTVGAFAIGFVAAAVFAVIGFAISALVSARERQVEFSLLHAVGLDRGQLSRWLLLEQAVLVLLSLVLGLAVGLGISEFLLPLMTLNQDGTPAVPELLVIHPWGTIWGFLLALVAVLAVAVAALIVSVARRGVGAGLRFGDEQ